MSAVSETPSVADDPATRLAALRAQLAAQGVDGFVIPHADEYQNEFLPASAERLAWLTGFTGSAGSAAVLADKAAIFTDGRYTLQLRDQADAELYSFHHSVEEPLSDWLKGALSGGQKLGYDPWLHTLGEVKRLRAACLAVEAELVPLAENPVDAVWTDRPASPCAPIAPHALEFAGQESADKRRQIAVLLMEAGVAAAVETQPDSIAWLLNVRGGDVDHTPLPLSFAIIDNAGAVDWFVDSGKLSPELEAHIGDGVTVRAPEDFGVALDALGGDGAVVQVCPNTAPSWVHDQLRAAGAEVRQAADPVTLPKAIKNDTELRGARAAHRRDGVALARFLCWLESEAPQGQISEMMAADKLAELRAENDKLKDSSFTTISGSGPNGAIVHYRVTQDSDRLLETGDLYLVDSGAQYFDGTTDVTRTVAIGEPTEEMRDRFTRVLKGHIALDMTMFPQGTTGGQLDALARQFLWQAGLDYDHGTGHGVGSYLGVHEGPQRISKTGSGTALEPGMVLSNEPGYYKEGAYGIRIENLVAVVPAGEVPGGEREMFGFETLTLAPIDRTLIDSSHMTLEELTWLNAYHAHVLIEIGPHLDEATLSWLEKATAPIK